MPDNACSNCVNAGIACKHSSMKKKRGPKAVFKNETQTDLESIRSLVSCILAEPETYIPDDVESIRPMLIDITRYAFHLQKRLDHPDRKPSASNTLTTRPLSTMPLLTDSPPTENTDEEENCDFDTNTISESLEKLSLINKHDRHFGPSSNYVLVQTLMKLKEEAMGKKEDIPAETFRRPRFWQIYPWQRDIQLSSDPPLQFPDNDLLHNLIDIYFTHYELYVPLLHRPTFERSVAEGLHYLDLRFGQVLLALCAVASRSLDDPRNKPEGVDNPHSLGWEWYRQIRITSSAYIEPPRLYDLQLCVLMSTYSQATSISESSWILLGIGMRLAQAVGIHRKRPGQPRTIERELWVRAFWAIVAYDTFASMFLGRPRVTSTGNISSPSRALILSSFDVEYPANCDEEYWENENPRKAFVQPADKPSKSASWIHFIKLMEIAGLVHRLIYPIRKSSHWRRLGVQGLSWNQKSVIELDSALNEWVSSVPEHVKWDPNRLRGVFFQQSVMLFTSYYWVQMQVHKPFIPRPGQDAILSGFPSLAICANAARSCINMVEISSKRQSQLPTPMPMASVFNSAIILLINFWRGKRITPSLDTGTEMREINKCFEILRPFEDRFQGAGRMIDILNAIISVGRLTSHPLSWADKAEERTLADEKPEASAENIMPPSEFEYQFSESFPIYSNELGVLPLYSSSEKSTVSAPMPPTFMGDGNLAPLDPSSTDLGRLGMGIDNPLPPQFNGTPYSEIPSASEYLSHYAQGPALTWGSMPGSTDNHSGVNSRETTGEDWMQFMWNVDEILQSASTDLRMTVDGALDGS
ncbi:hypothetical protein D9757_007121 [Collybiopsis confluens]|uniref:Xylanolytic transcriptional activator regulatory domain-containing protein n=1 Tax=Collybiopsis confluens TaxID=2823264 RepID=A0A8H5HCP2_9AGAR|nr:hypothetical protein D9757_007121 [Collybiopsis confluens]